MLTLKIVKPDDAMDWMTFVSSLVGSVAWPIAAFAIAYLFRAQIRKLLSRIRKFSVGDNSVDFGERLDDAENVAEQVAADEPVGGTPVQPPLDVPPDERTRRLLELSPSAVVMDRFKTIERKVMSLAAPLYPDDSENRLRRVRSFRASVKLLRQDGFISEATAQLLGELSILRNAAAHSAELTTADAIRFLAIVNDAERALERSA